MALSPQLLNGLSNTTAFDSVSSVSKRTSYSDTSDPNQKYNVYKKENSSVEFIKFPSTMPKYKTIIVGREFETVRAQKSKAMIGFVLPIPSETPLVDTYQVGFDDNFSLLAVLARTFGVGETAEKVGKYFGFNLNRQKSVLLEAPFLKRHEFRWKLAPRNSSETADLRRLIQNLKFGMMPPLMGNSADSVLGFPYIYEIFFEPNSAFLYPMKPCVIESLSINYTGNGQTTTFFQDGSPESIQLTLNLLELEFWTRQDWDRWMKNNDPVNTLAERNVVDSAIDWFLKPAATETDAEKAKRQVEVQQRQDALNQRFSGAPSRRPWGN